MDKIEQNIQKASRSYFLQNGEPEKLEKEKIALQSMELKLEEIDCETHLNYLIENKG